MIEIGALATPIGPLTIAGRADRVCAVHFGADDQPLRRWLQRWYPDDEVAASADPARACERLNRYFEGDLTAVDEVAVELNGTPFQRRVWTELRRVGPGTTASYAEIARRIGGPSAVRAVGAANGANPVSVIVPCHRIIGTSGRLVGYGGGLARKEWLLRHEGVLTPLLGGEMLDLAAVPAARIRRST